MTLEEFYKKIEGDYSGTLSRLMQEDRVKKYLNKFISTTDYSDFIKNYSEKNYDDAFRNIHSLKGVCLNLGLSKLGDISSYICDGLRGGTINYPVEEKFKELDDIYKLNIESIKELLSE